MNKSMFSALRDFDAPEYALNEEFERTRQEVLDGVDEMEEYENMLINPPYDLESILDKLNNIDSFVRYVIPCSFFEHYETSENDIMRNYYSKVFNLVLVESKVKKYERIAEKILDFFLMNCLLIPYDHEDRHYCDKVFVEKYEQWPKEYDYRIVSYYTTVKIKSVYI